MIKMEKLIQYKKNIEINKYKLKREKVRLKNLFRVKNKYAFYFMYILMVCCVIFNFGALTITDMIVTKDKIEVVKEQGLEFEFVEANPVVAKSNNYKQAETSFAIGLLMLLFKQAIVWTFIFLILYVGFLNIYTYPQLYFYTGILLFYFFVTGYDCFHDLGLLMGSL